MRGVPEPGTLQRSRGGISTHPPTCAGRAHRERIHQRQSSFHRFSFAVGPIRYYERRHGRRAEDEQSVRYFLMRRRSVCSAPRSWRLTISVCRRGSREGGAGARKRIQRRCVVCHLASSDEAPRYSLPAPARSRRRNRVLQRRVCARRAGHIPQVDPGLLGPRRGLPWLRQQRAARRRPLGRPRCRLGILVRPRSVPPLAPPVSAKLLTGRLRSSDQQDFTRDLSTYLYEWYTYHVCPAAFSPLRAAR